MHAYAQGAYHREEHKAHIHQVAQVFIDQQLKVFEPHHYIEFAFAVLAQAEAIRHLADAQAGPRRKHDVEQNLEADAR